MEAVLEVAGSRDRSHDIHECSCANLRVVCREWFAGAEADGLNNKLCSGRVPTPPRFLTLRMCFLRFQERIHGSF